MEKFIICTNFYNVGNTNCGTRSYESKSPRANRPQYHYSPIDGWIGDPCGLIYIITCPPFFM